MLGHSKSHDGKTAQLLALGVAGERVLTVTLVNNKLPPALPNDERGVCDACLTKGVGLATYKLAQCNQSMLRYGIEYRTNSRYYSMQLSIRMKIED